ncbi:MAG: Flp family type IVb pilin [Acidimicrobiales bacterium]|nr:Flp family type IVb pilin [Acidimicrobiales bacterium]
MLYFYVAAQNAANRAQKGAGMAEYALLLALIAVVCIAGFTLLGQAIDGVATSVAGSL